MKSVISENIKRYVADKRKLILLAVFAFFCGTETGKGQAANMSLFEYVLFIMSNHYYIVFFLLLSYIFFMFDNMREETELICIRLKMVKNQYVCRIICIFIQSNLYVLVHFILAAAIGMMRFGYSGEFMATPVVGYYSETVEFIFEYVHYFSSPLVACMATAMYMSVGLTFVAILIYIVDSIIGRKFVMVLIGVLLLDIMIGFKLGIHGMMGVLFLNNYFIMHHALFGSGSVYIFVNICIEIIVAIEGCIFYVWKKSNRKSKFAGNWMYKRNREKDIFLVQMFSRINMYSAVFIIVYVVFNVISVLRMQAGGESNNGILEGDAVADIIFMNLAGYSYKYFYIFEFIRYMIYYLVPVFFVGIITERQKKMFDSQVIIRYGRKKWIDLLEKTLDKYIIGYSLFFTITLGSTAVVLHMVTAFSLKSESNFFTGIKEEFMSYIGIDEKYFFGMVLFAFVLRILELIYYKTIYLFVYALTNNTIISFVITFLGYVPAFIMNCVMLGERAISYGSSSLYNLAYGVAENNFGVTVSFAMLFIIVKIFFVKKCTKICAGGRIYEQFKYSCFIK